MLKAKSGKRTPVMRRKGAAPTLTVVIGTPPPPNMASKTASKTASKMTDTKASGMASRDEIAAIRDDIAALVARLDALDGNGMDDDLDDMDEEEAEYA